MAGSSLISCEAFGGEISRVVIPRDLPDRYRNLPDLCLLGGPGQDTAT